MHACTHTCASAHTVADTHTKVEKHKGPGRCWRGVLPHGHSRLWSFKHTVHQGKFTSYSSVIPNVKQSKVEMREHEENEWSSLQSYKCSLWGTEGTNMSPRWWRQQLFSRPLPLIHWQMFLCGCNHWGLPVKKHHDLEIYQRLFITADIIENWSSADLGLNQTLPSLFSLRFKQIVRDTTGKQQQHGEMCSWNKLSFLGII